MSCSAGGPARGSSSFAIAASCSASHSSFVSYEVTLVRRAGERQELSGTVDAQVVPEGPGEHHDEWAHALILPTPRWGIVPRSRLTSSISRYKLYIK